MARYIDADELLNKLPDDLPYKASVKRVLIQAQEAEVVPRAELDAMRGAANSYKMHYEEAKQEADRLAVELEAENALREVRIERIFAEIEKFFTKYAPYTTISKDDIAELKKKYTEDSDES